MEDNIQQQLELIKYDEDWKNIWIGMPEYES